MECIGTPDDGDSGGKDWCVPPGTVDPRNCATFGPNLRSLRPEVAACLIATPKQNRYKMSTHSLADLVSSNSGIISLMSTAATYECVYEMN